MLVGCSVSSNFTSVFPTIEIDVIAQYRTLEVFYSLVGVPTVLTHAMAWGEKEERMKLTT